MVARHGLPIATCALLVSLSACETTAQTFNRIARTSEASCEKQGGHALFTKSEIDRSLFRGDSVSLQATCVGPHDSRYTHPGLQVLTIDSVTPKGAVVALVIDGYAGARAGLQINDIITAIDDHPVAGGSDLYHYTGHATAPTDVQIHVLRGRERLTLTAHL